MPGSEEFVLHANMSCGALLKCKARSSLQNEWCRIALRSSGCDLSLTFAGLEKLDADGMQVIQVIVPGCRFWMPATWPLVEDHYWLGIFSWVKPVIFMSLKCGVFGGNNFGFKNSSSNL